MHTIAKGKELTTSLWEANPEEHSRYRLMHYTIKTECSDGNLLLNTVTGELIQLSVQENILLSSLPQAYDPSMDDLIAHRFLVPEAFDELVSVTQLRKLLRNLSYPKDQITGYTILPTTSCNARCFYCYESEYPHCNMTDEVTEQLIDFIDLHCGKERKVRLSWFGGEPTLGERRIDYICESLKKRGIKFTSGMISNGYLFSKEMAHKAREIWHLRRIQITLDGTEEVYNSVKAYVNPQGSPYQRVINNIGYLLDARIHVSIRLNLDRHNADNLKELIDELAERFSHNDCFSVYVHEIFEGMGFEPIQRTKDEMLTIIEKKSTIETYIDRSGLQRSTKKDMKALPCLRVTYCMADNPTTILVNPQGELGKCQHVQFDHLVGDLWKGCDSDPVEHTYWMDNQPNDVCSVCELFPSCGVPQTCKSGRSCIPTELSGKMVTIRNLCRDMYVNMNRKQEE